MAVGHVTDVINGFILVDCVTVMVVVIAFSVGDVAVLDRIKGFSIRLTLNCLLLTCLLLFLFFCVLLSGLVGTGAFCIEGVLGWSG